MKASKGYFFLTGGALAALSAVCLCGLYGEFRAIESTSIGQGSEKRAADTLKFLHAGLRDATSVDEVKPKMKAFESLAANGPDSHALEKIRRAYGPALAVFADKPREAESRFLLGRKRELMEALVNAYRKEIPNGDIRLRAAYLNILFDTQASLVNEEETADQVYVKRNKERLAELKARAAAGDAGLQGRVANIESIFDNLERGLNATVKWKAQKQETLAAVEKSLPKLAREMQGTKDEDLEDARRGFLYLAAAAAAVILASFLALALGHKYIGVRNERRVASLLNFLREFGHERTGPAVAKDIETLQNDPDWSPVIAGALAAESTFIDKYQTLLAVPKSMPIPYVVFGRDKVARHWNEGAAKLLGLAEGMSYSLDDVLPDEKIGAREGDPATLREVVRNSFALLQDECFELQLKVGEAWENTELLTSPIASGPLAGGKVYLFRGIRSEAERISAGLTAHLRGVGDYVHKVTHGYPTDGLEDQAEHPEARRAMQDLAVMKRKVDEREALWKSETGALLDQVSRQREILARLGEEVHGMRNAQGQALEVVGALRASDEDRQEEILLLQRDLERWKEARRRLEKDLGGQQGELARARDFEGAVRGSTEALSGFLEGYQGVLAQLDRFSEDAKIHSVNLSFVQDQTYWEFAAHSRAYALELGRFVEQARELGSQVQQFVDKHPGGRELPALTREPVDATLLAALREEEEKVGAFLAKWRAAEEKLAAEGERALAVLRGASQQGAVATQLGDTILLINEQAQGNLQRWS